MRAGLKAARKEKGLTQEQMARLLGFRSKSHYCMIENGQRGVSVETALRISEILGKSVKELFTS
ncbi:helix-turn-helix transcriptional regulator [Desulfovirgula thermocuniculi]|uniref:helix-turn-helix transcriptional regulator n=1 Tax=Desulfovirgula thermocuniculi TaxID=348842 RepID=UPI00054F1220|nr:helix-turn-helix transcriptional regulator [Desulfovirgula thermocuniculi]